MKINTTEAQINMLQSRIIRVSREYGKAVARNQYLKSWELNKERIILTSQLNNQLPGVGGSHFPK